jgi:hypothetical protein
VTRSEREEQAEVLRRLRRDAEGLAAHFQLPLLVLDAERPQVKRRYGVCYSDGSIRIRLRHVRTRRLLKYSALVDTLCHELAHLRHFNHGLRFQALYRRILEHARSVEIYQPDPRAVTRPRSQPEILIQRPLTGPRQLELFTEPRS